MAVQLTVSDEALGVLKPFFVAAEGSCDVWSDEQVVTGMLIRGLMDYGRSTGTEFAELAAAAKRVRAALHG